MRESAIQLSPAVDTSDTALVVRAREGDNVAFGMLYDRHVRYIARVLHRSMGSDAELEDVVHDAFLLASAHLAELQDPTRFRSWLTAIALRQASHVVRRRVVRSRLRGLWAMSQPQSLEPPGTEAERAMRALKALPPKFRIPWVLVRLEGESLSEAAEASGNSLTTLKRRLSKADAMIEKWLRNHP